MGLMERTEGAAGSSPGSGVDAAGLARAAVGLLGAGEGRPLGGLSGLRAAFERAGLGAAFESWIGNGPNRPISASELASALGAEVVGRLARSAGADPARVAAGLAELLPRVVDQLTPAGVLPDAAPTAAASQLPGQP